MSRPAHSGDAIPDLQPSLDCIEPAAWSIPHPRPYLLAIDVGPPELPESAVVEHVTNTRLVRWIDRAAELHAASLGESRDDLIRRDRIWFVSRHEIDYCAEVLAGNRIVVATWVRDAGRTRSWRDTLMVRPSDGTVVLRAATRWVYMNLARRRPARIDADTVERLDPLTSARTQEQPACTSR